MIVDETTHPVYGGRSWEDRVEVVEDFVKGVPCRVDLEGRVDEKEEQWEDRWKKFESGLKLRRGRLLSEESSPSETTLLTSSGPSRHDAILSQALQLYGSSLTEDTRVSMAASRRSSVAVDDVGSRGPNGDGERGGRESSRSALLLVRVRISQ